MPNRILIADDHAVVRSGLRALLSAEPGLEVVGEADNGAETLRLAEALHPDTVILDISMPPDNGLHTAQRLKEKHGGTGHKLFPARATGDGHAL